MDDAGEVRPRGAVGDALVVAVVTGQRVDVPATAVGVVAVGEAAAMGAAVRDLRRRGVRAAGLVGDLADASCREAAEAMAAELFGAGPRHPAIYAGGGVEERSTGG